MDISDQVNSAIAAATAFFNLDQEVKDRYGPDFVGGVGMGYVGVGKER